MFVNSRLMLQFIVRKLVMGEITHSWPNSHVFIEKMLSYYLQILTYHFNWSTYYQLTHMYSYLSPTIVLKYIPMKQII